MNDPLQNVITLLARLPGLGPRSARRMALELLTKKDALLIPLAKTLAEAGEKIRPCEICCALDVCSPCQICSDTQRDQSLVCVVEQLGDLWALEREGSFLGTYHVLGGVLDALDDVRPENLNIDSLLNRVKTNNIKEVILATNLTVNGRTTAHFLAKQLENITTVSMLSHGVPAGGELDYLDDGTINVALNTRKPLV